MNSNLNNGVSMFTLQNSRGEVVDLDSDDLFGYTPTGLGAVFSNSYSQYDSYFKPTKKTIQQGQMSLNILFGSVESNSYQTFSDFASFLAYEPLTLIYTTKSESWYRDAVLSSLTKTEIGGTTVIQVDRLIEQFTIDFINPWYNNKTAEYKSYDPDAGLATFGKVYGTSINPALFSPNLVLNSSGENASSAVRPAIKGTVQTVMNATPTYQSDGILITYNGTGSTEWYYAPAEAYGLVANSDLSFGTTYTISADVMGTAPAFSFRVSDAWAPQIKINNTTWTKATYTFTLKDLGANRAGKFYIRLNATNGVNSNPTMFVAGQTLKFRHLKLEQGTTATPWTPAVSESKTTWNYGYFNVNSETIKKNQAYADLAKTDITYIEN